MKAPAPLAPVMNWLSQALTGLVYGIVGPALREENQLYILPYRYIFGPSVMLLLGNHKSNLGIFHSFPMSSVIFLRKTCGFLSHLYTS